MNFLIQHRWLFANKKKTDDYLLLNELDGGKLMLATQYEGTLYNMKALFIIM